MGVILIIVGVVCIAVGLFIVFMNSEKEEKVTLSDKGSNNRRIGVEEAPYLNSLNDNSESRKEKGNQFEDYVANLLRDYRLTLLERTNDEVSSAGVVAESCKNPDFHISQKYGTNNGTIDYYVECKYKSDWHDGKVTFEKYQLDRYRQFQRDEKRKVMIALGVGGTASDPETFMLVPLDSIPNNYIRKTDSKYVVTPKPEYFISYMTDYFTTVFEQAKLRKQQNR